MSGSKSNSKAKKVTTTNTKDDQFVDVLYQKLGENWFAFSLIDDEVFMSPVSEETAINTRTSANQVKTETDNEAA